MGAKPASGNVKKCDEPYSGKAGNGHLRKESGKKGWVLGAHNGLENVRRLDLVWMIMALEGDSLISRKYGRGNWKCLKRQKLVKNRLNIMMDYESK